MDITHRNKLWDAYRRRGDVRQGRKSGIRRYASAVTIGLLLGACNARALYAVADTIADRSKRYSESLQEWCFRALYLAATLWIPFAAFLGNWAASVAMRFLV